MSAYAEILLDHVRHPRNAGEIADADARGGAGSPGRSRSLTIALRIREGRVREARHMSRGCGITAACGSVLTEMIANRSLDDCRRITAAGISAALGGLPRHKLDCADCAARALHLALDDFAAHSSNRLLPDT